MPPPAHIPPNVYDLIVIGAGPAGALSAIRSAELGARTALVTAAEFGGMAATDGPVPVRALAFAARLMRDARQLPRYGITIERTRAAVRPAAGASARSRARRERALGPAREDR